MAKPAAPFGSTKMSVYLTKQIDALQSQKSQRDIAMEIGYDKPNMISMFKQGNSKVPLEKIPALAKALHVDAAHLFMLGLEQYWPNVESTIKQIFGNIATQNEMAILLKTWRELTNNMDPSPESDLGRTAQKLLDDMFAPKS